MNLIFQFTLKKNLFGVQYADSHLNQLFLLLLLEIKDKLGHKYASSFF